MKRITIKKIMNNMKITEEQLRGLIRESIEEVITEAENEGWFGDKMSALKNAYNAGRNTYKSNDMLNNAPSKYNPWNSREIENYFTQLNQQEHQLQVQLNQLRNKKRALMKKYGVTQEKGKGNNGEVNYNPMSVNTNGQGYRNAKNVNKQAQGSNQAFGNKIVG